jgi:hypothetical protein
LGDCMVLAQGLPGARPRRLGGRTDRTRVPDLVIFFEH